MSRERYRTPDEDVAAEFDRVCRLFSLALGRPSDRVLFDSLMVEANEQGMNWVEGLEYVVQRRGHKAASKEAGLEQVPAPAASDTTRPRRMHATVSNREDKANETAA